jgi:hypothetical protein
VRKPVVAVAVSAWLLLLAAGPAPAAPSAGRYAVSEPVPSLTPAATERLWRELVARGRAQPPARAEACAPTRAIFYAATDWLRLATRLAANPSPCAEYFVSVPPLVSDKSQPRGDEAWRIRALGPSFHALAEINVTGWRSWVEATGGTWYEAGVEARRRMADAGYDVSAGDTWALNELFAAVRQNIGPGRANMRDFLDGLYDGDGILPTARGVVWVVGIGQGTADLSVYQSRLQAWYEDAPFWTAMSRDVSDWQQEVYGDVRRYAVPGAPREARRDALNEYLQHPATLAAAAPPGIGAAKPFMAAAYGPLANAAWQFESGFGYTNVPVDLMQDFVSAQVYAARSAGNARFGFSWQPNNLNGIPSAEFTAQTNAILTRLAAAIADSSASPEAACGTDWCNRELLGATFTTAWQTFATWIGPVPPDTTPPETTITSGPPATVTATSATFTVASSEDGSDFECALDGGPFTGCGAFVVYESLGLGPHHFEVRAIDASGNPDPTPAAHDWTIVESPGRPHPPPPEEPAPRSVVPPFPPPATPRAPPPAPA